MLNCEALRAWIGSWLNPNGKCRWEAVDVESHAGEVLAAVDELTN
jgi:hypothetical protein